MTNDPLSPIYAPNGDMLSAIPAGQMPAENEPKQEPATSLKEPRLAAGNGQCVEATGPIITRQEVKTHQDISNLIESLRSRIRELEAALEAEHDMHMTMGNEASEMYGLLQKAEATITRLKSGDFTSEELQNLCHSRSVDNLGMAAFCDGCDEYQRKLFGSCRSDLLHARYIGTRKSALDRYLAESIELSMKLSSFCASTGLTDGHLVACTQFSEAVRRTMLEWAIENDATPAEMRAWYRLQHGDDT